MAEKIIKKVLDIDLDFFLSAKEILKPMSDVRRLEEGVYIPWSESDTRNFLEKQCELSVNHPIQGASFVQHDEVFYYLRKVMEENEHGFTFDIDHVDAHADLGMGDDSYQYLSESMLWKPLKERPYQEKHAGRTRLTGANYLAFCIACRWVKSLNYINKPEWSDDLPQFLFKGFDVTQNLMLKQFTHEQMQKITNFNYGDWLGTAKKEVPVAVEPEVPFRVIDWRNFKVDGAYDYVFLTQSPGYTPRSSDKLLRIIQSYIKV